MAAKRPDVHYFTHSLNELIPSKPELVQPMLQELVRAVEAGDAHPLPAKVFQMRGQLVDAFRHLQSGKAIGKVVVQFLQLWIFLNL